MKFIRLFEEYRKESRSNEISMDEAVDMYLSSCRDWGISEDSKMLFRGTYTSGHIFHAHAGSESHERRYSANNSNIYNSLITHLTSWEKAPSRDRSFIMSTSNEDASTFGDCYIMIPFNGTKIAECPENDMWNTLLPNVPSDGRHPMNMGDLDDELDNIFVTQINDTNLITARDNGARYIKGGVRPENIKKLCTAIDNIPKEDIILNYQIPRMNRSRNHFEYKSEDVKYELIEEWINNHSDKPLFQFLSETLDFDKLGYRLITQETMEQSNREIWSDGEFIGIEEVQFKQFVEMVVARQENNTQ